MTVSVSVPATASNLGGGFDCVGVAVNRRLHVTVGVAEQGPDVTVHRSGTLASLDIAPEHVSEAIQYRTFDRTLWI